MTWQDDMHWQIPNSNHRMVISVSCMVRFCKPYTLKNKTDVKRDGKEVLIIFLRALGMSDKLCIEQNTYPQRLTYKQTNIYWENQSRFQITTFINHACRAHGGTVHPLSPDRLFASPSYRICFRWKKFLFWPIIGMAASVCI